MASMLQGQGLIAGPLAKLSHGNKVGHDLSRVSADLSRGPTTGKKLNAAPWSGTWPAPGATLDLDFANDRGFVRGVGQGRSMDAVTFTRASNGTFVKPDGTLSSHANQGALGNNLLTFPQDFDNAAWTKAGNRASIVQNTEVAPDGTATADKLQEALTSSTAFICFQGISQGSETFVTSVYFKAAERQYAFLQIATDNATKRYTIVIDLNDGSVTATQSSGSPLGTGHSVSSVGNGWYRASVYAQNTSGLVYCLPGISNTGTPSSYADAQPVYEGVIGNGIYIWGAQLEVGSTATEYFPTNINTPRFDWASTAQRPQNLLTYTQQFDNAIWSKTGGTGVSVVADSTVAPDGTTTADTVIPSITNGGHFINHNSSVVVGTQYTMSVYAKASGYNWLKLVHWTSYANFDLTNGVLGANIAGGTASITSIGNGWYRCVFTFTGLVANAGQASIFVFTTSDNASFNGTSFAGNGTDGIYLWGAQLEVGTSALTYVENGAYSATNTPLAANPTSNGILIEEARTNRLLWNRDATDAAWVKTDVTAAKDQTGIDGVANAASSLTSTADNGTCIQTITLASGSRTGSVFLKRITGTGNVQVSLDGSTWSTVDLSDTEWRRIVLSGTVTNPTVGIKLLVSGDAVAMDYGQVEDGLFATSPILTTTASVTRAVDAATLSNIVVFTNYANTDKGTWFIETVNLQNTTASLLAIAGSGTTILNLGSSISTSNFYSGTNATRNGATKFGSIDTRFNKVKHATTYASGIMYTTREGLSPAFNNQMVVPFSPSPFSIGYSGTFGNMINGCISRLVFIPNRLAENALAEMTR
jgi:hypothetical protein